jgi:hypothetical protein
MSTAAISAGRAAPTQLLARLGHPFAQADPNIVSGLAAGGRPFAERPLRGH